ncbi:MAG: cell wall-associated NlpC family hydrolase [Halocynthiibacter sp.]|jgi:cell wall-associated NlpC family hydrolase
MNAPDRRLTPANARVALPGWAGETGAKTVAGEMRAIAAPLADLRAGPDGARDRQMLMGWGFNTLEIHQGWAFGQSVRDGYVGYIEEAALGPATEPTHIIGVRASHLYPAPDMKSEAIAALSFGAALHIVDERHKFMETDQGLYVPKAHLRLIDRPFSDPATVAQLFFGAPYLWGGNSSAGIDCSGLVQAALIACGGHCPGDSDLQMALGAEISDGPLARGDLIFWKGHVAICVEEDVLLHSNAHHMAVAYEPTAKAIARIKAQGGGDVTARRRL